MRPVHDILSPPEAPDVKVAFIQHGADGNFTYENVCPWCAETLGDRIEPPAGGATYGWLCNTLREGVRDHLPFCTAGGFQLRVYVTTVPLNTETRH